MRNFLLNLGLQVKLGFIKEWFAQDNPRSRILSTLIGPDNIQSFDGKLRGAPAWEEAPTQTLEVINVAKQLADAEEKARIEQELATQPTTIDVENAAANAAQAQEAQAQAMQDATVLSTGAEAPNTITPLIETPEAPADTITEAEPQG